MATLGAAQLEQKITELRFAFRIEADDFTIEHAAAAFRSRCSLKASEHWSSTLAPAGKLLSRCQRKPPELLADSGKEDQIHTAISYCTGQGLQ